MLQSVETKVLKRTHARREGRDVHSKIERAAAVECSNYLFGAWTEIFEVNTASGIDVLDGRMTFNKILLRAGTELR